VLRESMQKEGWDQWGKGAVGFGEFWGFLNRLVDSETKCSCREGTCGPPFCDIRKCAQEKGVETCPFCGEYPCHRIEGLAKGYVNLLADGKRMTQIGLERWIQEQEARKAAGFCYADIRCEPYEAPNR